MLESKLTPREELGEIIAEHRRLNAPGTELSQLVKPVIGLACGCFDLLHPGHMHLLAEAGMTCTLLIVGLNTDESVRRLKGDGHPIMPLADRAEMVYPIGYVDYVTSFPEGTPAALIDLVRPDLYFKGGDYALEEIVERGHVEAGGGRVIVVPRTGYSSTALRQRIVEVSRDGAS